MGRLKVLYEDDLLLVIDKPAGMPTTAQRGGRRPTVAEFLVASFPALAPIGRPGEAGLCHRLDNDTSGCLLVAKTPEAFAACRAQFAARTVTKEYLALLLGLLPQRTHWTQPIAHHPQKPARMQIHATATGPRPEKAQPAETLVEALETFPSALDRPAPYSLCRVTISTGVRHQIRVHAAHAGYPIAGDRLYQSTSARQLDRLSLPRHFLHACHLVIRHPATGEPLAIESPLPPDLREILNHLRLGTGPI